MANSKHISEDEIKYIVDVESTKAQQEIRKLEKSSGDLRAENKRRLDQLIKLEAAGKKNSQQYKDLKKRYNEVNREIKQNTEEIAKLTRGIKVSELTMNQLKKQAKQLQKQLDDTSKALNPEAYREIQQRLSETNARMLELKETAKGLKEELFDDKALSYLKGQILIGAAKYVGNFFKGIYNSMKEVVSEGIDMAEAADGITHAFEQLNKPGLLDNLRKATKGTVNDVDLMKAALQAKDFRIPLEDMGKYLAFAQLKAQQTGQSVEYMTNSIVTGLGRKSVMILDNLGISAAEVNEKTKETGDFMKAVASIVDKELAAAGETYISAADRAAQRTVKLQNAQKELGDELLPLREKFQDAYGFIQVGTIDLMKWMVKHRGIIGTLTVALIGLTVAAAAHSTALKTNIVVTKAAAAAHLIWNQVVTTGKGLYLLSVVVVSKMSAAMNLLRGNTVKAAAATTKATAAMRLFNAACKANVIGLVVTGIAALVSYLTLFREKAEEAKEAVQELSEAEQELNRVRTETDAQVLRDIATLKNFNGTKAEEIELVKQMNAKYGEAIGYYRTVKEWYDTLTQCSELYCQQMVLEAQARMIANQLAEKRMQQQQWEDGAEERQKHIAELDERTDRMYQDRPASVRNIAFQQNRAAEEFGKMLEDARLDEIGKLEKQLQDIVDKQMEIASQLHIGPSTDPYAGGNGGTGNNDAKQTEQLSKARQESLREWSITYQQLQLQHKEALAQRQITQEEYDRNIALLYQRNAQAVLLIERSFYEKSQGLQLEDDDKKKEVVAQYNAYVQDAELKNQQSMLAMQEQYYDALDQILQAGQVKRTLTLQQEKEAELAVLEGYYKAGLDNARQFGMDENAITEAYNQAKASIVQKYADKELAIQKEAEQKKQQARKKLGIDTQTEYEQQLAELKSALEMQYITQEEYEQKVGELKRDSWKKQFDYYQQLFGGAVKALQDAELANVDAKYDAEIEAARKAGKDTTALENKKANEKLKVEKKYADVQFAIKASEIIANTAVSIMKALAQLGPIAGPIAAALMGVTGAAQLAAANAERQKIKKMTLNGASGSTSAQGTRVATGLEEGGSIDVERKQDGKRFHAKIDPDRRGYVERPTVIVGEGPTGKSREWVASNAALSNPTVAPLIDIIDRAQRVGNISTLDMRKYLLSQQVKGLQQGGSFTTATVPGASPSGDTATTPAASAAGHPALDPATITRLCTVLERLDRNGVRSIVALDDIDAQQKLRTQSRKIGSKQ